MHENFEFLILEMEFLAKKNDRTRCLFCSSGSTRLVSCPRCECTAFTLASTMENMITKLYHDQSVLVPFFLFLKEVCCKKVENGTVENGLGPKGHKEDNLRLQVYLTSK